MNKVNYLKNFPKINSRREKNYYFFRGFLWCLNPEQTCKILDLKFEQDKFKMDLIIEKILRDIEIRLLSEHIELFNNLLKIIYSLNPYYRKERCAKYLTRMFVFLPTDCQKKLINNFLNSKYRNNRNRGYGFLLRRWKKGYDKVLINSWHKFGDVEAIRKFIEKFPEEELKKEDLELLINRWRESYDPEDLEIITKKFPGKIFKKESLELLINALIDEDEYIDFETKILRNNFYAKLCTKIIKYFPDLISNLKITDPISYIYITKESGRKVDLDYALNVFRDYPASRKYLLFWFGQMKLWKLIKKIKKHLFAKSRNFLVNICIALAGKRELLV